MTPRRTKKEIIKPLLRHRIIDPDREEVIAIAIEIFRLVREFMLFAGGKTKKRYKKREGELYFSGYFT